MRLFLTTSYPGGAEDAAGHFVQAEARSAAREGDLVWVLAPGPIAEDDTSGLRGVALPHLGLFGWPGALPRLKEDRRRLLGLPIMLAAASAVALPILPMVREIVAHWLVPCAWPLGVFLHHFPGTRTFTVVAHGSDVRLLARYPRLGTTVVESLARAGADLRCVSEELVTTLRSLARTHHCREWLQRARVEPIPIELEREGPLQREVLRAALGVEGQTALVVGRLIEGKRVATALEAGLLLENTTLVVIGSGPELASLQRRFPMARFLGQLPRDQTLKWIAAADVVLSASRYEGAPTALREARALGTPVVSVRAGDLERWSETDPGLWVVGG